MEWSNSLLLKSIKNTCPGHIHVLTTDEITFHGFPRQPDYATIEIEIQPGEKAVELKSVKEYFKQFRETHISYERLLEVVYNDFKQIYEPELLKIALKPNNRGGISSILIKGDKI